MAGATSQGGGGRRELDRLIFFSDAVFAIAITLLALDVRLPAAGTAGVGAPLAQQLATLGPNLYAYALSFVVIGGYWVAHHRTFKFIVGYDTRLLWLDLPVLFFIALLPFPTQVVARYGSTFLGVEVYAGAMTATGLALLALFVYAVFFGHLASPDVDRWLGVTKSAIVPAVFAASMVVAIWSPIWAANMWWLIAVVFFLVDPMLNSDWRRLGRGRKEAGG